MSLAFCFCFYVLLLIRAVSGLIAFDCSNDVSEYQILDTTDLQACNLTLTEYKETSLEIQLLQTQEILATTVYQCYISVDVSIRHCGMHSHVSYVQGGEFNFIKTLTQQECVVMWKDQSLSLFGVRINGIIRNGKTIGSYTIAGHVTDDGSCSPSTFAFQSKTWKDVIAFAKVDIRLYSYSAMVDVEDDKITLRKGLNCKYTSLTCLDSEEGNVYWDPVDNDICYTSKYDVLYSGLATRQESQMSGEYQTVFSVKADGHIFALMTKKAIEVCGITVYSTEHPKLFIAPKIGSTWFFKKQPIVPESVNLFTYLNSKFVYLERHIQHEMERLYKNILENRCSVSRQLWYNQISLLSTSPADFAYTVKQQPGYMALVLGELVYITKCMPVTVQVRQASRCYQELPITYNNETYFMTPRHHLVTKIATEIECSNILYSAYKLHGQWWGQTPVLVHVPNPEMMTSKIHDTWKYHTSGDLINSGIYTSDDLEKYRKFLTNPNGRQASLSNLGSIVMGMNIDTDNLNLHALVNEHTMDHIIRSYMEYIWGGFVGFGEIISGCIGVYLIIRLIKFLIDTIIHGITLYPIYGCSVYLVASLWDAVTMYLFKVGNDKQKAKQDATAKTQEPVDKDESIPLQVVTEPRLQQPNAPQYTTLYPRANL